MDIPGTPQIFGRWLTPEQVAEVLGVTTSTLAVWRSTKKHRLDFYKIGTGIVLYKESDVHALPIKHEILKR